MTRMKPLKKVAVNVRLGEIGQRDIGVIRNFLGERSNNSDAVCHALSLAAKLIKDPAELAIQIRAKKMLDDYDPTFSTASPAEDIDHPDHRRVNANERNR